MAHRYGHPIKVKRTRNGRLVSFRWQGSVYAIAEVFSTWHLMDRWWEQPVNPATHRYSLRTSAQDRT